MFGNVIATVVINDIAGGKFKSGRGIGDIVKGTESAVVKYV